MYHQGISTIHVTRSGCVTKMAIVDRRVSKCTIRASRQYMSPNQVVTKVVIIHSRFLDTTCHQIRLSVSGDNRHQSLRVHCQYFSTPN